MKQLLIIIAVLLASVALLSVRVILKKNGRFSSQHISQNRKMRERGIHCANTQDWESRRQAELKLNIKNL